MFLVANSRQNSRKFEQKRNVLMGVGDTIVPSLMPPNSFYCVCVSHTQTLQNLFVRLAPAPFFRWLSKDYPCCLANMHRDGSTSNEVWRASPQRWLTGCWTGSEISSTACSWHNLWMLFSLQAPGWGGDLAWDLTLTWLLNLSCPASSTFLLASPGSIFLKSHLH